MINLTPHTITVRGPDGIDYYFQPSGTVARVEMKESFVGECPITGATVIERIPGAPTGLPIEGTPCLVSSMVLAACPGRLGVFAPDTGETAIRNERGMIVAVTRLVAA